MTRRRENQSQRHEPVVGFGWHVCICVRERGESRSSHFWMLINKMKEGRVSAFSFFLNKYKLKFCCGPAVNIPVVSLFMKSSSCQSQPMGKSCSIPRIKCICRERGARPRNFQILKCLWANCSVSALTGSCWCVYVLLNLLVKSQTKQAKPGWSLVSFFVLFYFVGSARAL